MRIHLCAGLVSVQSHSCPLETVWQQAHSAQLKSQALWVRLRWARVVRLVAKPNSKTYGSPSVKAAWWADLTSAGTVSRSIFWPVPNVDSSLVRFVRHQNAGDEVLRKTTFKIIDAAFAQRRKMMRAALSDICGSSSEASAVIEASGIDPTIRGEALELADFIKIAITLSK